jgi:hypothetical protein
MPERFGRRPEPAGASDLFREESPMRTLRTVRRHARYPLWSLTSLSLSVQLN